MNTAIGICRSCLYVRSIRSARGSEFYLCRRAEFDPEYPRYPPLPVFACRGFEPASESDPETGAST